MRISRKKRPEKPLLPKYNINEAIVVPQIRLIDTEGKNLGVMNTAEAIRLAREQEMDVVEINPKAEPPVAQMIAFNHFKYQKEKELRKQKINSKTSDLKGIRLSIRIGEHDMDIRVNQSVGFLERGDKIKPEVILRGREMRNAAMAFDVLRNFFQKVDKQLPVRYEQEVLRQGNKITSILIRR